MTEEEFKSVMTKTIYFIVIALIVLIVIGCFVFNKSGKSLSIFKDQKEIDEYKKKVKEASASDVLVENLDNIENAENENNAEDIENVENAESENNTEDIENINDENP